ncbi:DUF928 domain-containing protein [Calothrix membranacea FACHB-236]|nr:DUF928 domain-containing protein [Calothrix membranacea FACHB-236]
MKFYRWKMGLALALALALIGFGASKGKAQPFQHRQQLLADIFSPTAFPVNQNSAQQPQPQPTTASPIQFKRPPLSPRGAPGNRKGGGTRDGYSCAALEIKERLMALVPAVESEPGISHVWGLTLEASPTLWFYVPYQMQDIKVGELEIWDETDSDPRNYQQTYQGTFNVTDTPGAIALTLPSTVKLEPGKNYHWYLTLNMNCDREAQAVNVNGWIQRVKLNNNLPSQQLGDRDRVIFYAENGIWYDAITLLAQMRRRQPQPQILLTDWQTLLGDIGLQEFANKPIAPCCQLKNGD